MEQEISCRYYQTKLQMTCHVVAVRSITIKENQLKLGSILWYFHNEFFFSINTNTYVRADVLPIIQ